MASFLIERREEMTMISAMPTVGSRRNWRAAATGAVLVLSGAGLSACKTSETVDAIPYSYDYRERHPITLREGSHTVEVFIGRRRGGLTPSQRDDVDAFAQEWHRDSAGGVEIRVPAGTANERSARETVPEVRAILTAAGVPANGIVVQSARPTNPDQLLPITLAFSRISATAGPCGRWPNDLGPGAGIDYMTNKPYYNLGCSMQHNMAAMVDNPADLVQPRGESGAYTGRRTVVLDKYRKGEDTTAIIRDNEKSKISDVGK
jgi:pilus assembly protein CpaD